MGNQVLISYKRVDRERVFEIKEFIETHTGLSCWIDLDGIESDALFEDVIIDAIDSCELFLYFYSKEHLNISNYEKDWTIKELDFAQEEGKRIVFINLDNTPLTKKLKFRYRQKQQVDAQDPSRLGKLVSDIKKWFGITDPITKEAIPDDLTLSDNEIDGLLKELNIVDGNLETYRHIDEATTSSSFEYSQNWKKSDARHRLHANNDCNTGLPKSLLFNYGNKKFYMILSDDESFYLGNLNTDENDLSWWDNKWIQTMGIGAICAGAIASYVVALPVAILLGISAIHTIFSKNSTNGIIVDKSLCDKINEATGYHFDVPSHSELKGVKMKFKKGCIILRINDNLNLISKNLQKH